MYPAPDSHTNVQNNECRCALEKWPAGESLQVGFKEETTVYLAIHYAVFVRHLYINRILSDESTRSRKVRSDNTSKYQSPTTM